MQHTVLIVDDEPHILTALNRVFKRAEIAVDACQSGRSALQKLALNNYDCIISDYKMPELDGLEFLELASELRSDIPRILLSGHADFAVLEKAINNCKIESYLAKPWSNDHLVAVVKDLINESQDLSRIKHQHREALSDLERASKFQKQNLPERLNDTNIQTGIIFAPLSKLSGDLINYYLDDTSFNYSVIDAAGHGTVAAMEAYAIQMLVNFRQYKDPKEFIDSVNRKYSDGQGSGLFTMTSAKIDFEHDKLVMCQAGHPNSYLVRFKEDSKAIRLGAGGLPIGYSSTDAYEAHSFDLEPNDFVITFSENFTDQITESLEGLLDSLPAMNIAELEGVLEAWLKSVPQTDDISAVLMAYKPDNNQPH